MVAKKPRVVIVGAGMAGLTAAHRLHTAAGDLFDLCVVEAGDRIGGRILTAEFDGDRIEMGATWIHGIGGSPIYAIAGDIHALSDDSRPWERMDGFPEEPVTVAEGGALVDPSSVVRPVSALYRRLMDAARAGDAVVTKENPSVGSFIRRGLQQYRTSRYAAAGGGGGDWTLEAMEEAVFAMHENWERTCTSVDDLDRLDLAAESEYRDFPGDQITIARGYSSVVEWLAAAVPSDAIHLGRRLRRIEWRPDGGGTDLHPSDGPVRLHFDDLTVSAADHVIVTVSLGVLKAGMRKDAAGGPPSSGVVFSPGLPTFKKGAIERLGFGVVNKLFMEVDDGEGPFPFLQMAFDQGQGPERHVAKIPRWMRGTSSICPIYGGSRVLLAWLAGEEATELEAMGDEEIIRGVHATIDGFLPAKSGSRCDRIAAVSEPSGGGGGYGRITRVKRSGWGMNPLFLGSYSYVAVGSSGDDLDLMAEPLPRCRSDGGGAPLTPLPALQILFAGEATHRTHYSTTHGAYFSGIREADRLLRHYHCISS